MSRKAWLLALAGVLLGAAAGLYLLTSRQAGGPFPEESAAVLGDPVLIVGLDVRGGVSSLQDILYLGALLTPDQGSLEFQNTKRQIEHVLKEVETRSGVKFGRDVESIGVALFELGPRGPDGVAAVIGHFDAPRVLKAVEDAVRESGVPAETREIRGTRMITGLAGGEAALAVPNHRTVLVGSPASVERALSRSASAAERGRTALDLLRGARPDDRFWLAIDHRLFEVAAQQLPNFDVMKIPVPTSLLVVENPRSGVESTTQFADVEAARKVAETIREKLASGKLEGVQLEEAQPFLEVRTDRSTVHVRVNRSLLTGTASLGIVAAIAIPALLRARVNANEASAVADVRTVISAEARYANANGSFYGDLRCLAEPKGCLPAYDGPPLLDPGLASLADKNGYRRSFFPGPQGSKPGTYQSFAYTAAPVTPNRTGMRSFCGGHDGVVCERMDGQPIAAESGRCPSDCIPLR